MADVVFNTALGRVAQWCQNVEDNSPVAATLQVNAWIITATDADVVDVDDIAALEAVALVAEAATYTPQVMDETDITITVDDTGEKVDIDLVDQTFTAVAAATAWSDITVSYDFDGSDTDATTVLMTMHDFIVTPNGGDITVQWDAAGFFTAT